MAGPDLTPQSCVLHPATTVPTRNPALAGQLQGGLPHLWQHPPRNGSKAHKTHLQASGFIHSQCARHPGLCAVLKSNANSTIMQPADLAQRALPQSMPSMPKPRPSFLDTYPEVSIRAFRCCSGLHTGSHRDSVFNCQLNNIYLLTYSIKSSFNCLWQKFSNIYRRRDHSKMHFHVLIS